MARRRTQRLRRVWSIRDPSRYARFGKLSRWLTYFARPGRPVPDWPTLLYLYSRMKSGKTILEWIQEYKVEQCGIDVRRFTSFGVIKVFEEGSE